MCLQTGRYLIAACDLPLKYVFDVSHVSVFPVVCLHLEVIKTVTKTTAHFLTSQTLLTFVIFSELFVKYRPKNTVLYHSFG